MSKISLLFCDGKVLSSHGFQCCQDVAIHPQGSQVTGCLYTVVWIEEDCRFHWTNFIDTTLYHVYYLSIPQYKSAIDWWLTIELLLVARCCLLETPPSGHEYAPCSCQQCSQLTCGIRPQAPDMSFFKTGDFLRLAHG